jgi:hypothetical protein
MQRSMVTPQSPSASQDEVVQPAQLPTLLQNPSPRGHLIGPEGEAISQPQHCVVHFDEESASQEPTLPYPPRPSLPQPQQPVVLSLGYPADHPVTGTFGMLRSTTEALVRAQHIPSPRIAAAVAAGRGSNSDVHSNYVMGTHVEYYSNRNRVWMLTKVIYVDADTGAVTLDMKPNTPVELGEQQHRLRPRRKPSKVQAEWVRKVLAEGRVGEAGQEIFNRYAAPALDGKPAKGRNMVVRSDALDVLGQEIDGTLGVSGAVCVLKHIMQKGNLPFLTLDVFGEIFWEMLWTFQKEFAHAIRNDEAGPRRREVPQEVYNFEMTLGRGTFGVVKFARSKASGDVRAVKIVSKQDHQLGSMVELDIEIEHLRRMDHPHIVKLYDG